LLRRLRPDRPDDAGRPRQDHRRPPPRIPSRGNPMSASPHGSALLALSPLDGRYAAKTEALRPISSEFGLMQRRVRVELHWLLALAAEARIGEVPALSDRARAALLAIDERFGEADGERIKAIERTTNHDVKAVEYFIKEKISGDA